VEELADDAAQSCLRDVAKRFVREDMRKRFLKDFGHRRGVRGAYFARSTEIDRNAQPSSFWQGRAPAELTGWGVWGSYEAPIGFKFRGAPWYIGAAFMQDEGDVVAALFSGGVERVLFLTHTGDPLLLLPCGAK